MYIQLYFKQPFALKGLYTFGNKNPLFISIQVRNKKLTCNKIYFKSHWTLSEQKKQKVIRFTNNSQSSQKVMVKD